MNLLSLIRLDFNRKKDIFIEDGAKPSTIRMLFTDGTSANVFYRIMFFCGRFKLLMPFALFFQYFNRIYNGCIIGVKFKAKSGFVLMHPIGVVINSKTMVGNNITVESGVVIGSEKGVSPCLGNNIFIGAGAKIIGNVTIGNNVKIGANAVVVKNIPSDCTALGIPATVRLNRL
jgi:serine O-acetyltransferase